MKINRFALGALAIGLSACVSNTSSSPSSTTTTTGTGGSGSSNSSSALSPGAVVDVGACTEGMTDREVDQHLAMVFDLEQSYHEMVACGGLVVSVAGAVIEVIASLVEDPNGGLPRGVTRDGGVYTSAPGGGSNTVMTMRFFFGDDYEVGAEGDMVEDNVFALKSYLENPRLDVDYTTGELLIRYDSRGPLVELLGFGATPPRPLRISPSDVGRLTREIEKLEIQSTVLVDDARANSTVVYELESDPVALGDVATGDGFGFEIVTSAAWSDAPEQDMETLVWDVDFQNTRGGGLNGDIEFVVDGGAFAYEGLFEFRNDTWPETTVTCAE